MKQNRIARVFMAILAVSSSASLLADGETLGLGILGAAVGGAAGGGKGAAIGAGAGLLTGAAIEGSRRRRYYDDDYIVYTDDDYDNGNYVVEKKTTIVKPRRSTRRTRKRARRRYEQPKTVLQPEIEEVEVIQPEETTVETEVIEEQE